jgi:hypothetical protein
MIDNQQEKATYSEINPRQFYAELATVSRYSGDHDDNKGKQVLMGVAQMISI